MIEIGETAGTVWQRLAQGGPALVRNLSKELGLEPVLIQMSLGWLAREGKVTFEKKGKDLLVALSQEEMGRTAPR